MTSSKDKRNTEYFYTQMHLFIFLDKPPIVDDEEIAPFNLGEESTVDLKHLDGMLLIILGVFRNKLHPLGGGGVTFFSIEKPIAFYALKSCSVNM